jgi:NAD+ synthase
MTASSLDRLTTWMRERVAAAGARGIVVGLSGGIDSAVVLGLAVRAMPGRVAGVLLPCHSDPQDETDGRLTAAAFGVEPILVDLGSTYDTLRGVLDTAMAELSAGQPPAPATPEGDPKAALPLANIKPRLRMASLYFVANSLNYLVAGTGNRSELTIGYFTKYGDGGVDMLPIGRLLKSEVRALARDLGVPQPIVDKAPSAGLWLGQTDEAEMGFTYAELEDFLTRGAGAVKPAVAGRIERLARISDHKRATPPMPDM